MAEPVKGEESRRARHAALAAEIGTAFTTGGSLSVVLQRCCESAVRHLDVALARLWTMSSDERIQLQASAGMDTDADGPQPPIAVADLAIGTIAQARQPLITNDLAGGAGISDPDWARREGIVAFAGYPLIVEDRSVGVFALFTRSVLPEDTLEALSSVARTIAIGVKRKRAEHECEKLVEELERTVHFNAMFAAILGHDLRNPLNAMMTGAQIVRLISTDEKVLKPIERVLSSGARMARMIDQLLDFTRVRIGGGFQPDIRDTDLQALVKHIVDEEALAHPERTFDVDFTGDLLGQWDPDALSQVFSNLISNAIRHGSPGAAVVVRADGTKRRRVQIAISNAGAIPPDILPVLFDPFRGTERSRGGRQGLGLGLFITQQIVRAHGGDIAVASSVEAGTTFAIDLPRQRSGQPGRMARG